MRKFPKILIVNGEPLNGVSATGITVANLFKDWPNGAISQIYTANIPTNADQCKFSSRLTARDLLPFARLRSAATPSIEMFIDGRVTGPSVAVAKIGIRAKLQYACAPLLDFLPYRLPISLMRQVEEFQPDLIYSLLGNIRITRLAHELGRRLRIPVVPHFMDDWLATYSVPDKSSGTWLHRIVLNRAVQHLFDRVPFGMAIGDMMAKEYSRKFGCDFLPFMNPVDSVFSDRETKCGSTAPLVFVYVGGLHLRRDQVLLDLIDVLSRINQDRAVAELHIYAPKVDEKKATQLAELSTTVHYCGSIAAHEVAKILKCCDVAVHVESTEPNIAQYTRFSVSTKIPQYLAAGLPTLAYGPAASASSSYIEDSKVGVSVAGGNKSALFSAVSRLVSDCQWREELSHSAVNVARERHLGERVRYAFTTALSRAASMGERAHAGA
ncbi:glycosyltransferase [Variovorax beijingensis]|uniref:Glycosyltransferase n=1 Tax=Variovorax beijingensis TaxID=2496117 RepID=A0ABY0A9B5_9BURK|nr:glycosyltransferase [Variovorax beijingensis]RSZ40122.1 glycosyltransferase [Variovorax beijingensis]